MDDRSDDESDEKGKANNPIFVVEGYNEVDGGQNGGENIEGSEKEVVEDD